jgi:hypothetical protein
MRPITYHASRTQQACTNCSRQVPTRVLELDEALNNGNDIIVESPRTGDDVLFRNPGNRPWSIH